jgi:hypothetical protein
MLKILRYQINIKHPYPNVNIFFIIQVTLHSPAEYPFPLRKYFHVSPESQTMIAVQPELLQTDSTLKPPRSMPSTRGCVFQGERPSFVFKVNSRVLKS